MTHRTIDAANWIFRQPKTVQEVGEARGEALIRQVVLRNVSATEMLHEAPTQAADAVPKGG